MKNIRKFYGDTIIKLEDLQEGKLNNKFKIEYYQMETSITDASHLNQYGIEILKKSLETDEILERKEIMDITNIEEKINNLLDILYRNKVTPISVIDVIDDLQYMGFIECKNNK